MNRRGALEVIADLVRCRASFLPEYYDHSYSVGILFNVIHNFDIWYVARYSKVQAPDRLTVQRR